MEVGEMGEGEMELTLCIECATVLQANTTHVMCKYEAGEGVPCCLAPPLRVKLF